MELKDTQLDLMSPEDICPLKRNPENRIATILSFQVIPLYHIFLFN